MLALKGRLTSMTLKTTFSVPWLSGIPNVTEREMLPCGMMEPRPTPQNGHEGESQDMGICSFWKVVRLMRLRASPPSIMMWYSLTLVMGREMTSRSCRAPDLFLGQSKVPNMIDSSIHLLWGAAS
jgi:hypothetical protein